MDFRRFEWDSVKAATNSRKHGVTFEEASKAFEDPHHIATQDRIENGEERWQTIGLVRGTLLLLVAHTVWDNDEGVEVVRIISARPATAQERRIYNAHRAQDFF